MRALKIFIKIKQKNYFNFILFNVQSNIHYIFYTKLHPF